MVLLALLAKKMKAKTDTENGLLFPPLTCMLAVTTQLSPHDISWELKLGVPSPRVC